MPFHQATYLLPCLPLLSLTLLSSSSSSSSSCSASSSTQRKKTFCLTNKSLLPPYACVSLTFVSLYLCHCLSLCVSAVGADRGAVSRCLCQRIQRETQEGKQAAHSSSFSLSHLCSFTSSRPFYSDALFPHLSLSTPA